MNNGKMTIKMYIDPLINYFNRFIVTNSIFSEFQADF